MHRIVLRLSALALTGVLALPLQAPPVGARVCDEDCLPVITKLPQSGRQTCYHIAATMDGGGGDHAVKRSQRALDETIEEFRRDQPPLEGWRGRLRITPMKPKPKAYWRNTVAPDLMLGTFKTKQAYTLCWRGMISPVVCTSGSKVCK